MQQYSPQQLKTRKAVVVFLKNNGAPLILYVEESETLYNEIKQLITSANEASPKLVEKSCKGPVKKFAVLDTMIAGVAIQEEPYV